MRTIQKQYKNNPNAEVACPLFFKIKVKEKQNIFNTPSDLHKTIIVTI